MPKKSKKIVENSENEYDNETDINEDNIDDGDEDEFIDEDNEDIENEIDNDDEEIDFIKNDDNDDNDSDINIIDNDDINISNKTIKNNYITGSDRISANRLTKYEMVRILGERTKQLTMGAKPLVKNHNGLLYENIAEEEFKLNMIPFKIVRKLPNGYQELWTLDELYKEHLMFRLEE
jgi:DNA-directed RNA polymerase subunit K/omega